MVTNLIAEQIAAGEGVPVTYNTGGIIVHL